jgi:hypothetical protein
MTFLPQSINGVIGRALIAIYIAVSGWTGAFAQQNSPSALQIARKSSFFTEGRVRESAADLIASFDRAVKAGADINEVDTDGSSAFTYALVYAVTNSEGAGANPILKALFRLGVDVNKPIGPTGGSIYPVCATLIWGTFNNDLLDLLFDAGASKKVKCDGLSLEDAAKRQSINPELLTILKKHL